LGAEVLITDGIGPMAVELLKKMNIKVMSGVKGNVKEITNQYLNGKLKTNENPCDH
jgi:predicted Fe-Mo cluster-binding NifX family protein